METIIKTVKQHSLAVEGIDDLRTIARKYTIVKNYVYSRYSGINSLIILKEYKRKIRDIWVKDDFAKQWNIPARYWKMALDEAITNIKSQWTNIRNRVKLAVHNNTNLTEDEGRYILYILKSDILLYSILTHKNFSIPEKISKLNIREKYILNLVRRYIRRYKGSIPYSYNSTSFMIDSNMYGYKIIENKLYLNIQGLNRGKRITVQLKDGNIHKGNLRILLKDNSIEVHKAKSITVKVKENIAEKVVGIDKGYRSLIVISEGKFYGDRLNDYLSNETERLNNINAERNRHWALMKMYESKGNEKKADNIRKFNLGMIKYNNNKRKYDSNMKSYINAELDRFIKEDSPTEVVLEDLTFVSWNNRYPAHIKRKLSRWIKGYIQERLDYKCKLNNITQVIVNAAYTSQVCHHCGKFGLRENDIFRCNYCGTSNADYNASINIKSRKYDMDINIYTPYKKVKEIITSRMAN